MSARNLPVSPERLRRARQLFEDGASQREVTRTTGIGRGQLRKYFPGQGWTFKEGGEFRALTREDRPSTRGALPWWEGA